MLISTSYRRRRRRLELRATHTTSQLAKLLNIQASGRDTRPPIIKLKSPLASHLSPSPWPLMEGPLA